MRRAAALLSLSSAPPAGAAAGAATVGSSGPRWLWHRAAGLQSSVPGETLRLSVALAPRDPAALERAFLAVTSPSSPRYGQLRSFAEVVALTEDAAGAAAVMQWLRGCGAPAAELSAGRDWVTAELTAAQAGACLNATFARYEAAGAGASVVRATAYTVPAAVARHVIAVSGVARFPDVAARRARRARGTANVTTPSLLRATYGVPGAAVADARATQGVFEQGQSFDRKDLKAFQKQYGVVNTPVTKIVGTGNDPADCDYNPGPCIEGEMDTQYITAMAPGAPVTYYAYGSYDTYTDYVKALSADPNCSLVQSMSYGWNEHYEDPADMKAFDTAAQKLALRGVTFLASTGDDGVANQRARGDEGYCGFYPSFPATSRYVVAVGATQGPESGTGEVACSARTSKQITSGGGFSETSARPAWQEDAVAAFLSSSSDLPKTSHFASKGRAYPDVALMGLNYDVCVEDECKRPYQVSGTSASCPVMAGLVTRANAARLAAGKPALGAVGPALYHIAASTPAAFNDITSGDNKCTAMCEKPECSKERLTCCSEGFVAQKGWDAVTGLGSVNFAALQAALQAL